MQNSLLNLLDEAFTPLASASEGQPLLEREFFLRSQAFDRSGIQESFSWRTVHIARLLACELIDDRGHIDKKGLFAAIHTLENHLYSLGPERHHDFDSQEHMLAILKKFHTDPAYDYALKRVGRPTGHLAAERLIRETLLVSERTLLKDAHARRAVLAALLTWLRQNVGSCFATAPAIMIQQSQPLQFLADMAALLSTGRLVRIIDGHEYAVPLSVSWGAGLLFYPIVNRTVEELASSPGLAEALGSKEIEKMLAPFKKELERPFSVMTADAIIKETLLKEFKITEKDVEAFFARESLGMMSEPTSPKHLACSRFLKRYEEAKSIYKAMTENALLRAWEYTLASLAESKADFAAWNLYSSLGLSPEEPEGIGLALQQTIQEMIEGVNREIEAYQSKYEHLFAAARYLEGRMRRASEREIGWLTADYNMRRQEINRLLFERDEEVERGRRLSSLFSFTLKFFCEKFKDYFQEIYDAEMHNLSDSPYDDSPAGFRLLYKHGRANTALWTPIHNEGAFIQALTAFFAAIEVELTQQSAAKDLYHEVGLMITAVIRAIKAPSFIQAATKRLRTAYKDPKRLPWAYLSGGTMSTLVSCYYALSEKPREQKRWAESPTELLAFYIDTIKELSSSQQREFVNNRRRGMLAYSPTHAFLLQPGCFEPAWNNDSYTYTWIRDTLLHPAQDFLDEQRLESREIAFLVDKLLPALPKGYQGIVKRALEKLPSPLLPFEFRANVVNILSYEKWLNPAALQYIADEIDSICFKHLPLFPEHQLQERLEALFYEMEELDRGQRERLLEAIKKLEVGRYFLFSSLDLLNVAKGLLISLLQTTRSSVPFHQRMMRILSKLGFSYPEPLIVGDSNWVKKRFAFVVSPGSRELELWCVDNCGSEGRPLSIWKPYLDGSRQQDWGLFTSPAQYGQS